MQIQVFGVLPQMIEVQFVRSKISIAHVFEDFLFFFWFALKEILR